MKFNCRPLAAFSCSVVLLFFITGCSKSNNSSSNAGISATVGSSTFSAGASPNQVQAVYNSAGQIYDVAGLVLTSKDTTALEITVPPTPKLGMPVSSDTALVTINYSPHFPSVVYMAGLGNGGHAIATITSLDSVNHKIAGTFSGVVYNQSGGSDSLVITNGKFNTSYTVQ